jgi:hypothetical protein
MRKILKYVFLVFSVLCLIVNPLIGNAENENQCVNCHTNAKRLIDITREIAKTRPVGKDTEKKGEG